MGQVWQSDSSPKALTNAAVTFVDSLKINSISEKTRRRRRVVIKQRNGHSKQLAGLANLYFSHVEHTDPLLEQHRRLETLGTRVFPNAERRSFSCLSFAIKDGLRR